jgi:hypothetical protein
MWATNHYIVEHGTRISARIHEINFKFREMPMTKLSSRTLCRLAIIAVTGSLFAPVDVSADTLDLNSFPLGIQDSVIIEFPGATISTDGSYLYIGAMNVDHEICALNRAGNCQEDMKIDFTNRVNDLSFVALGWDPGDLVSINVYNGASLLGTVAQHANGLVDLTAYSNVTSIFLDDSSTGGGMAYDHFKFTTPVPEPESYAMTALGLALLGAVTRRRKTRVDQLR